MKKLILLNVLITLITYSAFGQNKQSEVESTKQKRPVDLPPIATDRPDQTESPYIVPTGMLQIETGYWVENDKDKETKTKNRAYNTSLIKLGLSSQLELRVI